MSPLKIVFYGTPEFAVQSLSILARNNYNIAAVVTAPDKPAGRGQKMTASPVKEYALEHNLKVLQPTNLKDEEFLEQLKEINPDLQIVVAFRMMPEAVWKLPKLGTFNLHASLLPQYRGAAPINWAIINGEKETGVTTFFLRHDIDTGSIIMQEKMRIEENETAGTLYVKLMAAGASLVLKTVHAIEKKNYSLTEQSRLAASAAPLKDAPKLTKQNTKIDFSKNATEVLNFIKGLCPYPAAHTELDNPSSGLTLILKIFSATAETFSHDKKTGTVESDGKSFIKVYVKDGAVSLTEIQVAGRSKMTVKDFLNGFKLEGDWIMN
jgi:methionyl-tRNA formyltransferase